MDSLTYGLIFPFIVEYMSSLEVPKKKIGLYAGISEGSLMLAEAAAAPFWAKAADKNGRKRCATLGFLVSALASGCSGFGHNYHSDRSATYTICAMHGKVGESLDLVGLDDCAITTEKLPSDGLAMNDHLNSACFDDYPELIATGSAITLIAGVIYLIWCFVLFIRHQEELSDPPSQVFLSLYVPEGLTKEYRQVEDESLENEDENLPLVERSRSVDQVRSDEE
ncbi:uncharacterized protein L199_005270 [Kwoniella botswanensis]|uniref:uncharacterized protein n=1 Tax=Kwoniella botswanensis TaxID=1268659 RepID=UPI00315D21C2